MHADRSQVWTADGGPARNHNGFGAVQTRRRCGGRERDDARRRVEVPAAPDDEGGAHGRPRGLELVECFSARMPKSHRKSPREVAEAERKGLRTVDFRYVHSSESSLILLTSSVLHVSARSSATAMGARALRETRTMQRGSRIPGAVGRSPHRRGPRPAPRGCPNRGSPPRGSARHGDARTSRSVAARRG